MIEENLVSQWDREVSVRIHKQKLENIKNRDAKPLNKSMIQTQASRKMNIDRSLEISRENRILYEKLMNISERKKAGVAQKPLGGLHKNFNMKFKKLEADRIAKENMHLVNRLSLNNSELSFKKMIKDYKVVEDYREMISRRKFQERIKKAVKVQAKASVSVSPTKNSVAQTPMKPAKQPVIVSAELSRSQTPPLNTPETYNIL